MLNAKNVQRLCASALLLITAAHALGQTTAPAKITGEDDTEFVFTDKCKNGATYRLKAYKIIVNRESIQMYDFDGPRGKGTIQSDVEPREAKALLCLENKSAWVSSGRQAYK